MVKAMWATKSDACTLVSTTLCLIFVAAATGIVAKERL